MGYTNKQQSKPKSAIESGPKDDKPYLNSSTDLALTPPQKEWSVSALDARLQKHADAIEKTTADARTSSIESDTDNKKPDVLSDFGFNEKTS